MGTGLDVWGIFRSHFGSTMLSIVICWSFACLSGMGSWDSWDMNVSAAYHAGCECRCTGCIYEAETISGYCRRCRDEGCRYCTCYGCKLAAGAREFERQAHEAARLAEEERQAHEATIEEERLARKAKELDAARLAEEERQVREAAEGATCPRSCPLS